MTSSTLTFRQYMALVDRELIARAGITSGDLADYGYRDAYDDGMPPVEVAEDALAYDGMGL